MLTALIILVILIIILVLTLLHKGRPFILRRLTGQLDRTRIPALGRRECNIGAPARCGKGSLVCVDAVCGNFDFRNATKGE
jgi:hypothetical protein